MRSVILYGATHILFAAALAVDPAINLLRVHEHIEYNRHVMDDIPDEQGPAAIAATACAPIDAGPTSLVLVPTAPCQVAAVAAPTPVSAAAPAVVTVFELDDEDETDDEGDYTVWQTVIATETDISDDGDSSCGYSTSVPAPPAPPPVITCAAPPPPPCNQPPPVQYVTVTAQSDGSCNQPDPAPAPASDEDSGSEDEEDEDTCAPPPQPPSTCPSTEFEHQYGDDAVDWIIDTKDHARNRVEHAKDRTARHLSHIRPKHVHDRVSQVLHDRRPPPASVNHIRLHQDMGMGPTQARRAQARRDRRYRNAAYSRDKNNRRVSYERSNYYPVRRPARVYRDEYDRYPRVDRERAIERVPVRGRITARDPYRRRNGAIHDTGSSCGCSASVARARRPIIAAPEIRDTCPEEKRTGCADYEHQYGDDTMSFLLDTKDHTRNFLGRVKDRTKHTLSHFAPSHVHDRADQFLHDERPERSEDHMELHENHGYLS